MLQAVVVALLRGVADSYNVLARRGDLAAVSRGDLKFAVLGGYIAGDDLTVVQLHA